MSERKNTYCVIMAGGVGSRFWPFSRERKPKQFLDVLGIGKSLLQQTYNRLLKICDSQNVFVVTSQEYVTLVKEQLPDLADNNILGEPARRNTAPCVAYAAHKIKKINSEANILVAPSDHLILEEDKFTDIIRKGLEFTAENDVLLTLGITPTRPETGYGYIQIGQCKNSELKQKYPYIEKVKVFTEKPELELAKEFVKSGEFLWNSGIFLAKAQSFINAFDKYLPDINENFREISDKLNTPEEKDAIKYVYGIVKNISIDYGIMEKADNVYVIPSDFDWSDMGTWHSVYEKSQKDKNNNVIEGENVMVYDSEKILVKMPNDKLVVINGLKNVIIVEKDGMLLISDFAYEQKIRQIVNDIKLEKGEDFI